jgi:hypothetical protein
MTLTTVTVAGRGFLLNTRQRFNRIGVSPRPADASSGRLARFGSGSTTIAVCKSFSILLSIRNATYLSYWMYWAALLPRCNAFFVSFREPANSDLRRARRVLSYAYRNWTGCVYTLSILTRRSATKNRRAL